MINNKLKSKYIKVFGTKLFIKNGIKAVKFKNVLELAFVVVLFAGVSRSGENTAVYTEPIEDTSRKPNVILIVSDDHGYADFSYKNIHDYIKTPNFDRLKSEGVEFTNGYATSPICSPSRCGILTGRYQQRWGTFWYAGNWAGFKK